MKDKIKLILPSIISIVIGLIFGFLILASVDFKNSFQGFLIMLGGSFYEGWTSVGNTLFIAAPLILTGLSVAFAFKTGLFNIGASGQYYIGAFVAVFTLHNYNGPLAFVVAMILAFIAGAIWGGIAGFLKAYFNVHEVISSIMLNYISLYLVNYLVVQFIYDFMRSQSLSIDSAKAIPTFIVDKVFPNSSIDIGILITIVVVIIIYFVLYKTTFGYELRACGFNKEASIYAGINAKKRIIQSMLIAGGIAGLAGSLTYISAYPKNLEIVDILTTVGFDGIPVALLALSNPLATIVSGFFIAHLKTGGFYLQSLGYVPEVVDITIAIIIYFSSLVLIFKILMSKLFKDKGGKK